MVRSSAAAPAAPARLGCRASVSSTAHTATAVSARSRTSSSAMPSGSGVSTAARSR
ncbi:MAG TPA: hypothetical protein VIM19_04620 [Actinomycetes bacterium]